MNHLFRISAFVGLVGVALGAFGAHALREIVTAEGLETWHTATLYHLVHAVVALIAGAIDAINGSKRIRCAGWLFLAGIVLFSGSLYALAVIQTRIIGIVTPFGGICFMAGWLYLALGGNDLIPIASPQQL